MLRDCAMRTLAHDMSSPSSSDSGGPSHHSSSTSSVDQQKNVRHNHTYPATPGQSGRRSDRKDKAWRETDEEHAMRCRDEKRAKEMQVGTLCVLCVCSGV